MQGIQSFSKSSQLTFSELKLKETLSQFCSKHIQLNSTIAKVKKSKNFDNHSLVERISASSRCIIRKV
jgi:hypothetical protein